MQTKLNPLIPALAAVALSMALAACDKKPADTTAGQKLDSAVASAEQKTDKAVDALKQSGDSAGAKLSDAAITTGVNAGLAADANLSALKIDVDTADGKVRLTGTAPTEAARQRATEIAQQRDGVRSVDNQLAIKP